MPAVQQFLRNIRSRGIYYQLLFTFIGLILLVSAFLEVLLYTVSSNALTAQISNQKIQTLQQTRNSTDVNLKDIEKANLSLAADSRLLNFSTNPFGNNYYWTNQAITALRELKNANRTIYSVYVYVPLYDIIITSDDGWWKSSNFYDLEWKRDLRWKRDTNWLPTRLIHTYAGDTINVVSLVMPLPIGTNLTGNNALLITNISESVIYHLISNQSPLQSEETSIISADGRVISQSDKPTLGKFYTDLPALSEVSLDEIGESFTGSVKSQKYLAWQVKSSYNGWRYVNWVDEADVLMPVFQLRIPLFVFGALSICLGLIVAFMVAARIYRPISRVVETVRTSSGSEANSQGDMDQGSDLEYLHSSFVSMAEKNRNLTAALDENQVHLQETFLQELLIGVISEEKELDKKLIDIDPGFFDQGVYVIVIGIDKYNLLSVHETGRQRDTWNSVIKKIIAEQLTPLRSYRVVQTDRDKYAAVIRPGIAPDQVILLAKQMVDNVRQTLPLTVTVGVALHTWPVDELSRAYVQALDLIRFRVMLSGDRVITDREFGSDHNFDVPFSPSLQDDVTQYIHTANIERAKKEIDHIIAAVQKAPNCSPEYLYEVMYSFLGDAVRGISKNGWTVQEIFGEQADLYRGLLDNENIQDMGIWLKDILQHCAFFLEHKKEKGAQDIVNTVIKYMQQHFNQDIRLSAIADQVYLSQWYLSRRFREETGQTFMGYLTGLRIEKAKEMLHNPDFRISDIAAEVNLGNDSNFIKTFKKIEGVTPGQYRSKFIDENLGK